MRNVHSRLLQGDGWRWMIELAASWLLVMLLTGVYLWWPRPGQSGLPRAGRSGRAAWRQWHAFTGAALGLLSLVMVVTGITWSQYAGEQVRRLRNAAGQASPRAPRDLVSNAAPGAVQLDWEGAWSRVRSIAPPIAMSLSPPSLIVDLRDNRGGGPRSVALLISYFVDQRTRVSDIWDRDTGITTQHWTQDKLDGKRYGGKKPALILAGPGTMSAGEDFAYTMQALKRATVVGERTWGGAHPARPYRLGDHFVAVIPGRRSISPITHTNWEGVGVVPDIAATQDKALALARDLLQRRLHGTAPLVAAGH